MKIKLFVALLMFILFSYTTATAAPSPSQDSELVKVSVDLSIENPEYFWQYPFSGKHVDRIFVSSMGQKICIPASSSGQKLEFNVPRSYQFRMSIDLQGDQSTLGSIYFAKRGINVNNNKFSIVLKAPDAQLVIVNAVGFDETKK